MKNIIVGILVVLSLPILIAVFVPAFAFYTIGDAVIEMLETY